MPAKQSPPQESTARPYYAHEAFPWIGAGSALTLDGLFSLRDTHCRREWANLLLGEDEQIAEAALRLGNVDYAGLGLTREQGMAFALHLIGRGQTEELIMRQIFPADPRLSAFAAGIMTAEAKDPE